MARVIPASTIRRETRMCMMRCRRIQLRAILVLAGVLGFGSLANAQHTGLFPNWQVRREKPGCANEAPEYHLYRQAYYGVYPTCWRKFPPGWGCLSPEAPNAAKSFEEIPRLKPSGPGVNDIEDPQQQPRDNEQMGPDQGPEIPGGESPLNRERPGPLPDGDAPSSTSPRSGEGAARTRPTSSNSSMAASNSIRRPVPRVQPTLVVDDPTSETGSPAAGTAVASNDSQAPTQATQVDVAPIQNVFEPEQQPQRRGLIPWLFSSNRPRLFR